MYKMYCNMGRAGSIGLLVLRVVAGLALMLHGWGKIQHPFTWMGPDSWAPGVLQGLAALAEFGGGLGLILGLLTPVVCLGVISVMATAICTVHLPKGQSFVGGHGQGSFELPLLYLAVSLALLFVGPGLYALDSLIAKRSSKFKLPSNDNIKDSVNVR